MNDAVITVVGRLFPIAVIVIYLIVAYHRVKSTWHEFQRVIMLMVACSALLIVSSASAIPKPVTMIADIIRMTSMSFAMFFAYISLKHLYQRKSYISILKDPFFAITVAICLLVVVADLNRSNFGVITDNDPVKMDFFYATSALACYLLMTIFSTMTLYLIYKTASSSKSMIYRTRLSMSGIGFLVISICCISVLINITLAYFGNLNYRDALNAIYHYGKLIYFPTAFIAIIIPERHVNFLLKPIYRVQERRLRDEEQNIQFLHEKMINIVPSVRLDYGPAETDDMNVEIADARMILWTNIRRDGINVSPKTEATAIDNLLGNNTVFDKPGEYPPIQPPDNERDYNISVAKHLRSLRN